MFKRIFAMTRAVVASLILSFGPAQAFDGLTHFKNTPLGTCTAHMQAAYTPQTGQGRVYLTLDGAFPGGTYITATLSNAWSGFRSGYSKSTSRPVLTQSTIENCGISDVADLVISPADRSIIYTEIYPDEATGRQIYESQTYIGYSFIGTDDATGVRSRYEFAASGVTNTIAIASIIPLNAPAPEPIITPSLTTVHRTTPFDVDATFSRDVTGFDPVSESSDFNISNASVTAVSQNGASYTLTVVPTGAGDIVMTVPANAAQDFAGTQNILSSEVTVIYDPNVVLTEVVGMPGTINASPFDVTVVFDNDVSGFDPIGTPGDVNITNANVTRSRPGPPAIH
ncbi:Ig-like domain-containing protein [Halocynthiibacter namhaensis]|uniref:Ig-like domain-containing protein n=1 Tax=Halocynthiibacter namhaensis TaxID=1290553 RepID=UPI00057908F9|nr:Ig-like domain-containing protein [Halocynthiibacter namhaensis]